MKKAKFAALGLVAVMALAGCAATDAAADGGLALPLTGGDLPYAPEVHMQRDALIASYLAGANVGEEIATLCLQLAGLSNVSYSNQWVLLCESPDYTWDAYTDMWVPLDEAAATE